MKFKAVAWDVDGTLVDSEPLHHRALLAVCSRYGVDLSDITESRFCGVHINDVWHTLRTRLPEDLAQQEWLAAIEDYYIAHSDELVPIAHGKDAIVALRNNGIRQASVSNSSRRIVEANLRTIGVLEMMEFLVTLDDVSAGKPDPEPYRLATTLLDLTPGDVLAVEDSVTGVLGACAAGLTVVSYTQGAPLHPGSIVVKDLSDITALVLSE
ncbi:HAD family phosphatase [Pectobacteriaceae bacterium CE90]|nr:HAD family phosphatase [Pectobacteriaceae bacterium CE90]